jgi:hypothetical protein
MNARPGAALTLAAALLSGCSGSSPALLPAASPLPPPPVAPRAPAPQAVQEEPRPEPPAPPTPAMPDTRPRIASIGPHTWIYRKPEATGLALGYVRMGQSVLLAPEAPVRNASCGRGWYAVEPRGYVCLQKHNTTLDLHDPYFEALAASAPAEDAVWFYRYAYSNGAPMYSRLPTRDEERREDDKFGPRGAYEQLEAWARGHEELLSDTPIAATDPIPDTFAGGVRRVGGGTRDVRRLLWRMIPNGSIVAYTSAFEHGGRTWLLTPDLMLVPADRVREMRRSTFHGVALGAGVDLPLAWNRTKDPKPLYRRAGGRLSPVADALAAKTWVAVDERGETVTDDGKTYLPVRGAPDTFVLADDVTISRARAGLPKGVGPGEKWIEVKILPGTLTAYEGDRPVYATLFSPGKGGVPGPGLDHTKYATTALGTFPIEWKDRVDTMSSEPREPRVMWFADVPHIQYLRAPLAMHVALWHEDFGNPKSAECVNVSPEDGHFLFGWTDPALPEGWGGVRPGGGNGKSTPVVVTAR